MHATALGMFRSCLARAGAGAISACCSGVVTRRTTGVYTGAQRLFDQPVTSSPARREVAERDLYSGRQDCASLRSPVVRLDIWLRDPIAGFLVRDDGRSRWFVGWVSLMAAVDWAREEAVEAEHGVSGQA
jgi:hypothetical protein